MKMAVSYRLMKKQLIKSQLNIVQKVLEVIRKISPELGTKELKLDPKMQSMAYTELILGETYFEKQQKEAVLERTDLKQQQKNQELGKLNEQLLMRRLINADYFKKLKNCALEE